MGRKKSMEDDAMMSLRRADEELNLGLGGVINTVSRTFALMEISEEEIREAKDVWPERVDAINDAFILLKPMDVFFGKDARIYRHHCAELLERVAKDFPTKLATKAEVMLVISEASLATPMRHDYGVLYFELFKEIMGRDVTEGTGVGGETHEGATDDILDKLRKKMRQEWRTNNK